MLETIDRTWHETYSGAVAADAVEDEDETVDDEDDEDDDDEEEDDAD